MRILFVCVENSCRSQMAEAFTRQLAGAAVDAWSAGSRPKGEVDPTAVVVMREKGIELRGQRSKGLWEVPAAVWDYVVTMGCGEACPAVGAKKRLDWAISDPKGLPLDGFRRVRDEIEARVRELLASAKSS